MSNAAYKALLARIKDKVVPAVKQDVTKHLASLSKAGVGFYGYAIQTPTWRDVSQPIAVYNLESDLSEENKRDTYYRYSVDEWQHYENDALPLTTRLMTDIDADFGRLEDSSGVDDKYYNRVYSAFADALAQLKDNNSFPANAFLIVWNEDEELMTKFARKLNSKSVATAFAEEFGF